MTAHYAPSYVTMSAQVDWSVSFVNPASEWAVGKTATDYITVTPETDGALTATVECWEGFSSDILITATLRANNAVKADCLCVWIHTDEDGGDNSTSGGSSGDSSSSGNTDSGNTDSGNTDSGSTDSGNTDSGNIGSGGSSDGDDSTIEKVQTGAGEMIIYEGIINEDRAGFDVNSDRRVFAIAGVYNPYTLEWDCMECSDGATWRNWVEELSSSEPTIEGVDGNQWVRCGQYEDGTPVYACIIEGEVYIAYGEEATSATLAFTVVCGGADNVIGFNYYELSGG